MRRYALHILLRPNAQAARRLKRWAGARRGVYNAVIQQWRWRTPKRGYPSITRSTIFREITELRGAMPHCAAVPVHVLQQAALDALATIQRFYDGLCKYPRFLSKRRDTDRMRFPDAKQFAADPALRRVKLPKLGWVPARFPRALQPGDRITSLTVTREAHRDTWIIRAAIEGPLPTGVKAPTVDVLAVDLGIVQSATTSEGDVYHVRDETPRERAHRARLQRRVARSKKGSRRQRHLRRQIAGLSADVANRRRHDQHVLTTALVRQAAVVVLEDLRVVAMTASAEGTVDEPGTHVRQKAGLNRSLLGQGFGEIRRPVTYKCHWNGRRFLVVPAAYSSQTCAVCGHIDPKNRDTQAAFRCLDCDHTAHADYNAACVLRQRGIAALLEDDTPLLVAAPGTPGRVTKARPVRRLPQRPATRTHPVVDRRTDPPNAPPSGRRA